MFDFLKRKKLDTAETVSSTAGERFFTRLKEGLSRTRKTWVDGLSRVLLGEKMISPELLEALEDLLISADMGVDSAEHVMSDLTQQLNRKALNDPETLVHVLKNNLKNLLLPYQAPLLIPDTIKPYVILVVGVNGAGKTTTIGKLAKALQLEQKKVILAAGDTFRAAAVEQLQSWGERLAIPVIAQHTGADSASVIFDSLKAAQSRDCDVLIADTAGRLHTQDNLMEELKKVLRVMKKLDAETPHEILLVLDAGMGQNALTQAKKFHEALGVTSLVLSKLDGTAKGGIIFNIAHTLRLPIRFIGVGEGVADLRPFDASAFVDALFVQE